MTARGRLPKTWSSDGKAVSARRDHVWHEDRGFALRNPQSFILASRGDYCIFSMAIAWRGRFVAAHRCCRARLVCRGNRALLSDVLTKAGCAIISSRELVALRLDRAALQQRLDGSRRC